MKIEELKKKKKASEEEGMDGKKGKSRGAVQVSRVGAFEKGYTE